jgi:RND family efflux transporter MFP subunit
MGTPDTPGNGTIKAGHLFGFIFKVVIPICILVGALGLAKYQMDTKRKAQRKKPQHEARLVTVRETECTDVQTTVYAMGTVMPARQVTLTPQVSGQIISLSPEVIPGGLVQADRILVQIDTRDYEFTVRQRKGDVARAELNLKLEQGSQTVAQAEYRLLGEMVDQQDRELVLREPHLREAEAALEASEAVLDAAMLNLLRCTVTAPFNGIVQEKLVDMGAAVSPATPLLTLIGTDEYWVEVLVPVDQLQWIHFPGQEPGDGSVVRIIDQSQWGPGVYREGRVIQLLPDLEKAGRMARVLVSVEDPLSLASGPGKGPRLLVGSFIRAEIVGRTLTSVVPVARDHLRDGDNVWIMNDRDCLEIRPVTVVFRDKFTVYVDQGLEPGERLVITDIGAPVANMPLRLESSVTEGMPGADPAATATPEGRL